MKIWLLVVLATVSLSAGVTWLWLHQGSQLDDSLGVLTSAPSGGLLEFDDQEMVVNVVAIAPGDTKMNETRSITIPFHNAGEGPLKLQYERSSCKCAVVSVDNAVLSPRSGATVTKAPGEKGQIRIEWTPRKETCHDCDKKKLLIAVEFSVNDPRPRFASNFRFEIRTQVIFEEAAKP